MPSLKYVDMTSRGHIESFSTNKKGTTLKVELFPFLKNRIIKEPFKCRTIDVSKMRNIFGGLVMSRVSSTRPAKSKEVLNSIQNYEFVKGTKPTRKTNNI